jgi:hypothetical protein
MREVDEERVKGDRRGRGTREKDEGCGREKAREMDDEMMDEGGGRGI